MSGSGRLEVEELLACEAPEPEQEPPRAARDAPWGRRAAAVSAALLGVGFAVVLCAAALRGGRGALRAASGTGSVTHGTSAGAAAMSPADTAVQLWGESMRSCGEQTCDCSWVHSSADCNANSYATACGHCCCGGGGGVIAVVYDEPAADSTNWILLAVVLAMLVVVGCICYWSSPQVAAPAPPPPPPKDERGCCLGSPGPCWPCCTAPSCTIPLPSCEMPSCSGWREWGCWSGRDKEEKTFIKKVVEEKKGSCPWIVLALFVAVLALLALFGILGGCMPFQACASR